MGISKQTPNGGFFFYNPFDGAKIALFPKDRSMEYPRVYHLKPVPFEKKAIALDGLIEVTQTIGGQVRVTVRNKPTERYTITYPKRTKKAFAST